MSRTHTRIDRWNRGGGEALLPRSLRRSVPRLKIGGLTGGSDYYDAQMDDARLCLEVVKTAVGHGAVVANYVEAVAFERASGVVAGVRALDRAGGRDFVVRARQVLNATGPWADDVRALAGDHTGPLLGPTKGVHLVAPGPGRAATFLLIHPADRRVFFVIPWLGKTLLGTTDTDYQGRPDDVSATPYDVDYLLAGGQPIAAPENGIPSAVELAALAEHGGAFDWLADEPDLYSLADGEPV